MSFSKFMPSAAAILAAGLFAGSGTAASAAPCLSAPPNLVEAGNLTIGTALSAPPMGFVKDDQPSGFDPDLASALAEKMCLKPKFVNLAFQGLFPGLISKKFDVVSSQVGITDARKEQFDFLPVFKGGLRLVTQKSNDIRFRTETAVCGHPVSIAAGSSQMAALERVKDQCPKDKPMELKIFSSQAEALNEVAKKAVDAAYVDWPVAAYLIMQRPDDFVEASPVLSGDGPGTPRHRNGIVFRKGEDTAREAVAVALQAVETDGTYEKLLAKWNLADGNILNSKD
jgi:polar amino acid transport system substrate-binding protein